MTVTVKPLARSLREWSLPPDIENVIPLQWDSSVFESRPRSITNPVLEQGGQSLGSFFAYCSRIDLDYKCDVEEPDYGETALIMLAIPEGGDMGDAVFVIGCYVQADWTHISQDLALGNWFFMFGVMRGSSAGTIQGWIDNVEITPSLQITPFMAGPHTQQVTYGALLLTPEVPLWSEGSFIPHGELSLTGSVPNFGTPCADIPCGALILTVRNPAAVWSVPLPMMVGSKVIYSLTLTGAPDGIDDLTIPMSSFQSVVRSGEPSYLACVVPNSVDWVDEIIARPNGDLIIKKGYLLYDGTQQMEEIIRVNYETLQIDRGAANDSATLVGHKTTTATAPKDWTVDGVTFYGLQADGKRRIRAAMDLFLRPADTVYYGSGLTDNFIVGSITYIIDSRSAYMEVTEA
ncbi:MAG: hypothetical protein WCJ37_01075 [Syntrophus sp. (in: bacteria)]